MKKLAILALAGAMAVASLTGCSGIKDNEVVMTVGGDEVTADIANFYARYTQAQYETYYAAYLGDDMWTSEVEEGKTYEETVKDSVLDLLKDMYVYEDHMDEYDISLTDEDKTAIQAAAEEFDKSNGSGEKKKVSGSREVVERCLTLQTIQLKMQDAIGATADQEVSDEEAAQKKMQYVTFSLTTTDDDGNSVDLTDEEKEALKEDAQTFADGAKDAEDFQAYAAEQELEATESTFDSESTAPAAELIEAADKLTEGETTAVVETDTAYYVARLVSEFDKEATETKKDQIVSQRKQDKITETLDGWKEETEIKVNEDVWAKVKFTDLKITMKQQETTDDASAETTDDTSGKTTDDTTDDAADDISADTADDAAADDTSADTTDDAAAE